MSGKKERISNEDFVRAYLECSTYTALGVRLGLTPRQAQDKAYYLRKHGVKLPPMIVTRNNDPLDVGKLNKIIGISNKEGRK